MISIHTTLAGGDPPKKGEFYLWLYFNPHHPRGWRHFGRNGHRLYRWISIHTTLAGGDYFCDEFHLLVREISIHTTLAGGDLCGLHLCGHLRNFNPHHPRGWRQSLSELCQGASLFQSTPPSRVATRLSARYSRLIAISIHTTLAGGDYTSTPREGKSKSFQSTPPSRVATRDRVAQIYCHIISIHTTLAGGDQPETRRKTVVLISIHTTLAGGD